MEHSWLSAGGNSMMNAVCNLLLNKPSIVAWIGDYSKYDEDNHLEGVKRIEESAYRKAYKDAWKEKNRINPMDHLELWSFDYQKYPYLINNTKQLYVDFRRCLKENDYNDGWVVHPLSLLTATSNGKGGGDYNSNSRTDNELVGTWAFDELTICTLRGNYKELIVKFKEE